jgi:hypothetical protein
MSEWRNRQNKNRASSAKSSDIVLVGKRSFKLNGRIFSNCLILYRSGTVFGAGGIAI